MGTPGSHSFIPVPSIPQRGNSELHVLTWLSFSVRLGDSCPQNNQVETPVTGYSSCLSCFSVVPGIFSQINYLHVKPCLRAVYANKLPAYTGLLLLDVLGMCKSIADTRPL